MWELAKTPSRGGNSARSIFLFVLTAILAVFLSTNLLTNEARADSTATWSGTTLIYNNTSYASAGTAAAGNSAGIPSGSAYYTNAVVSGNKTETTIIYFAAGKTPTNETSATIVTYDTKTGTSPPTYSNPHNKSTITVSTASDTATSAGSCVIDGIGWFVCPVSNFLAQMMDNFQGYLNQIIAVQPVTLNNSKDALYIAWNIMRTIANVAFIIVFLIIIYSQLTSTGVNNYGIKKLLPRLIVGVIVVNLSYILCALAVDLSNVVGFSLSQMINAIRSTVFSAGTGGVGNASGAVGDWESVTSMALAGTAATSGLVIGGVVVTLATGGTLAGLWFLIVPALLGLILAAIVALLILAARQALIVILVIISPLAFVAYLLPNTEKWFRQWRSMFVTMMVFFPAFSLLFSGAQLAGAVIIKNASSWMTVILGMIVQVVPLAVTPWLLRFSGSTIQGTMKAVQNFNKRLQSRTGDWAKPRQEYHRQRGLATQSRNPIGRAIGTRATAQRWNSHNQRIKDRTAAYTIGAENLYKQDPKYAQIDTMKRGFEQQKNIIEKEHAIEWQKMQSSDKATIQRDIKLRALTETESLYTLRLDNRFEEIRAEGRSSRVQGYAQSPELSRVMSNVAETHRDIAIQGMRSQAAKNMQQKYLAQALDAASSSGSPDANLLVEATGIDPNGRVRAQANAIAALAKIESEARENTIKLINGQAVRANKTLKSYSGEITRAALNNSAAIRGFDSNIVEAAFEVLAQDGDVLALEDARLNKHRSTEIDQEMITKVLARNADTMKKKGGFHLQADPSLANASKEMMYLNRGRTLGNITSDHIGDAKYSWYVDTADHIKTILGDIESNTSKEEKDAILGQIYDATHTALKDPTTVASLTDRLDSVYAIEAAVAEALGKPRAERDQTEPASAENPDELFD